MAPTLNRDKNTPSSCGLASAPFFLNPDPLCRASPERRRCLQAHDFKKDPREGLVEKMVRRRFDARIGSCSSAKKA